MFQALCASARMIAVGDDRTRRALDVVEEWSRGRAAIEVVRAAHLPASRAYESAATPRARQAAYAAVAIINAADAVHIAGADSAWTRAYLEAATIAVLP